MIELVDRRVFGAIEFIDDLSETRVLSPLHIDAPGVQVMRNRSGFYVLREVDGITPEQARARAALKNIAEGTGTATDAPARTVTESFSVTGGSAPGAGRWLTTTSPVAERVPLVTW